MESPVNTYDETSLRWPSGWDRTRIQDRKTQTAWKKPFRSYAEAVVKELARMGVTASLISYNRDRERLDPGVAVYFSRQKKEDFSWQAALKLDVPAPTLDEIDDAYKRQAMQHHPDRGGDIEVFKKLGEHRKNAREWVLGTHRTDHEYVIACDKYTEARWNLAALRQAFAAIRVLDRVGVSSVLERTFQGFRTALPAKSSEVEHAPVA